MHGRCNIRPAVTFPPHSTATFPLPELISRPAGGRRLSWREWSPVTYRDGVPISILTALVHKTGSIHNVSQCCQRRIEPRSKVARAENLLKFVRVVFEIRERTDRQTNIQTRWSQYVYKLFFTVFIDIVTHVRWSCSSNAITPHK